MLFHDLGKAADGFQRQVRPNVALSWGKRHEVLSLAFLDWATPFSCDLERDYVWIAAAVATHHRDMDWIQRKYDERPADDVDDPASLRWMVEELAPISILRIAEWLRNQGRALGLALSLPADPIEDILLHGRARIIRCLAALRRLSELLPAGAAILRLRSIAYRGFMVLADHCGSAGVSPTGIEHLMPSSIQECLGLTTPYAHQKELGQVPGNAILLAPTGSGKTESSLLWLEHQLARSPTARFLYVLPFQASLNAMFDRLHAVFKEGVSLHHSRAVHALYRRILEKGYNEKQAARITRFERNLARLHTQPVRLLTPFQLLMGAFRLKGYECLFTDIAGSVLVFDEIHVYEVTRLAMLVEFIGFLVNSLGCRCLVMSATLPSLLREVLTPVLQAQIIKSSTQLLREFTRHRIEVRAGIVETSFDDILSRFHNGEAVLVVCNTVDAAIAVYRQLQERASEAGAVELLHGRFTPRDRFAKENALMKRLGTRSRDRGLGGVILVATQVVEVSLDVDFDVLFSEPAPLEALLQRFGRVNRGRTHVACPVVVFDTASSPNDVYKEQSLLVERGIQILRNHNGQLLLEEKIEGWLNLVYAEPIRSEWRKSFEASAREFRESCLDTLAGFNADSDLRDQFYKMFDGVEVLPDNLVEEFQDLSEKEPLRTGELLVNLRWGQFCSLRNRGCVKTHDSLEGVRIVTVPYSSQFGLQVKAAP